MLPNPAALIIGAVIVIGLVVVAWLSVRRSSSGSGRGGLFHGYDYRMSTSKTIAASWTIVLAFMLVSEILIALGAGFGVYMQRVLDEAPNRELYLILLGGPYAAAVFAKAVVTTRVNNGTLQKTDGEKGTLRGVVSNDSGELDLYDLQYVLFNVVAVGAVIVAFCADPQAGLPQLPNFMAFLTGGAALTYAINKGVTSNQPVLTAVHPQSARVGDKVTAYGNNLTAVSAQTELKAAVAGVQAKVLHADVGAAPTAGAQDSATFLAPAPAGTTSWSPDDRQQVTVTTPSGLIAALNNALAILPDRPVAVRLSPSLLAVASSTEYADIPVYIQGQFLAAPGATTDDKATATVSITNTTTGAVSTAVVAYVDDSQVCFTMPTDNPTPLSGELLTFRVQLHRGAGPPTTQLDLTVTSLPPPTLDTIRPSIIVGDPGIDIADAEVSLTGHGFKPPSPGRSGDRNVAVTGAEKLVAKITKPAGETRSDEVTGHDDRSATIKIYGLLAIPAEADEKVTIMLRRGNLESGAKELILKPRFDGNITIPEIPETPAGAPLKTELTVFSRVLSQAPIDPVPGDWRLIPRNTTLTGKVIPADTTDSSGTVEFTKLEGNQASLELKLVKMPTTPPEGVDWTLEILAGNSVIARGKLRLKNPQRNPNPP